MAFTLQLWKSHFPSSILSFCLYFALQDEKTPHWEAFKVPLFVLQQFHEGSIELKCYNFNVNATDSFIGNFFKLFPTLIFLRENGSKCSIKSSWSKIRCEDMNELFLDEKYALFLQVFVRLRM